jgi:hypothetical protein
MKSVKENFGWIKDLAMVFGMCGVLYLNLNYVTNSKFDTFVRATDARYEIVRSAIISIDKSLLLLQQNNKLMLDLQVDVKNLELKTEQIRDIQNEIVVQQKEDLQVNTEFRNIATIVHKLESDLFQIKEEKLSQHITDNLKYLNELDFRVKLVENKQTNR